MAKLTIFKKTLFVLSLITIGTIGLTLLISPATGQEDDEKPLVFKVILKEKNKEMLGILKMHFKKKFEAEWENGIFSIEFNKIQEIIPVDSSKKIVTVMLISGEKVEVKLVNSLFLDKTVFGKFEIHLAKIEKIVRKK